MKGLISARDQDQDKDQDLDPQDLLQHQGQGLSELCSCSCARAGYDPHTVCTRASEHHSARRSLQPRP